MHISSDEVFSKILKKPSIVQKKMMPHMKSFCLFNKRSKKTFFFKKKIKSKWPPKKRSFSSSPILNIFFHGLVLGLVGLIDAKGIDVAQPIWL